MLLEPLKVISHTESCEGANGYPFIPPEQEEEFCKEQGIFRRRLSNNAEIVYMPTQVDNKVRGDVTVVSPHGAYGDPEGKVGVTHMIDHLLISEDLKEKSRRHHLYLNTGIQGHEFACMLGGTANPRFPHYGVWPFIDDFYGMMRAPFAGHNGDMQLEMETQKNILKRENAEEKKDMDIKRFMLSTLYHPENPFNRSVFGKIEDIEGLTVEDVREAVAQKFDPTTLKVFITSEGDPSISHLLADLIAERFQHLPTQDRSYAPLDKESFGKMNPLFSQGEVYRSPTAIDDLNTVYFTWVVDNKPYSRANAALNRLSPHIYQHGFDFFRNHGLCYSASVDYSDAADKRVIFFGVPLDRTLTDDDRFLKDLIPLMMDEMKGITQPELDMSCEMENMRQEAEPLDNRTKFKLIQNEIMSSGQLLDISAFHDSTADITPDEMNEWVTKLSTTPPAVIVV